MPTYLDCIPHDIHDHIAYHLYSSIPLDEEEEHMSHSCYSDSLKDGKDLDSLLNYSKESPAQKRSVSRAMSHLLYVTGQWRRERVIDWISLFANRIQELDISISPKFSFPGMPPRLPNLQAATILDRSEQLSLIHSSPKLSDLIVIVSRTKQWDRLVSTISSLPLKSLQLDFLDLYMMENMSRINLMSLRHATPEVENLCLDCCPTSGMWDMIKGMRCLKSLSLFGDISEKHIPFVQTLSELELFDPFEIEDLPFASVITSLSTSLRESDKIYCLASLSNLQKLSVKLEPGLEIELVGAIDSVEDLSLAWEFDSYYECVDGVSEGPHVYCEYYEPGCSDLENIVRSVTNLKSLRLENAILPAKVIRKLLKICGNQLENLEISHDWQREDVPTRMESILKDVALYCPKLTTLSFLEDLDRILPIFAEKEESTRCLQALKGVCEAVPGFESFRYIRSTIENRFTDQRLAGILTWDLIPENDIRE